MFKAVPSIRRKALLAAPTCRGGHLSPNWLLLAKHVTMTCGKLKLVFIGRSRTTFNTRIYFSCVLHWCCSRISARSFWPAPLTSLFCSQLCACRRSRQGLCRATFTIKVCLLPRADQSRQRADRPAAAWRATPHVRPAIRQLIAGRSITAPPWSAPGCRSSAIRG